jgi:Domain of unknown function (DUF4416)
MAQPKPFAPVKLICGVIYREDALYEEVKRRLVAEWGPADLESPDFAFDLTDYYEPEMGPGLERRFLSFERLIAPESLAGLKLRTIGLEDEFRKGAGEAGRPANVDPGYLTASALVMATAKDFAHRIPLGGGIYAHLEFLFTKTGVKTLDWTYPDFRREACQGFFRDVRGIYLGQLRGGGAGRTPGQPSG